MTHKIDWTTIQTIDLMNYKTGIVQSGTAVAVKFGKIVYLSMNITAQATATGQQAIFSLTTGIYAAGMYITT